jgi:Bacteriorhodopsin-like protein
VRVYDETNTARAIYYARYVGRCSHLLLQRLNAACRLQPQDSKVVAVRVGVQCRSSQHGRAKRVSAADWAITTPLLLLDILLMSGLAIGDTLWIVFADIAMIVTGLFGALLPNRYKWGASHEQPCAACLRAERLIMELMYPIILPLRSGN